MVDDLTGPQIASFLDEHVREMLSITPPESKHALDLETLRGPGITFWSVMDGDRVVGCGALKRLDARHAEVKSMHTPRAVRGRGAGATMLRHIIDTARALWYQADRALAMAERSYPHRGEVGHRSRHRQPETARSGPDGAVSHAMC